MKYTKYLKNLTTCPFCNGKNEAIIQSSKSFLTYALSPYHKHHLLVIPNRHVESLSELDESELEDIDMLQEKGLKILKKLGYESITLLVREGNAINKSINHTHFHIIPKITIGNLDHYGKERVILTEKEINETLKDIESVLS